LSGPGGDELERLLRDAERLDPPPELARGVMAAVRARPAHTARRAASRGFFSALFQGFTPLRAAALAFVLLVGLALGIVFGGHRTLYPSDHRALSGTALPKSRLSSAARGTLARNGLRAEASVSREGGGVVLRVEIDSPAPVAVAVEGVGVARSVTRDGSPAAGMTQSRGRVDFTHSGGRSVYATTFEEDVPGPIRLRLGDAEPLILEIPRGGP
jgi:hypothetical protein